MTDVLAPTWSAEGFGELGAVFDHVAVAAPRIRDLLPLYRDVLGGVGVKGGDVPRMGYRCLQLGFPDGTRVELMEPHPRSTFFDSFFRRGGGVHHVTFAVPDIRAALAALEEQGFTPYGTHLDDPEWQEVFVHPREAAGTLVQLAQPGPGHVPPGGLTIEQVLAGHGRFGTGVPSP